MWYLSLSLLSIILLNWRCTWPRSLLYCSSYDVLSYVRLRGCCPYHPPQPRYCGHMSPRSIISAEPLTSTFTSTEQFAFRWKQLSAYQLLDFVSRRDFSLEMCTTYRCRCSNNAERACFSRAWYWKNLFQPLRRRKILIFEILGRCLCASLWKIRDNCNMKIRSIAKVLASSLKVTSISGERVSL